MALTRDQRYIPLTEGADTQSDAKFLPEGRVVAVENGEWSAPDRIDKRKGFEAFGVSIFGGGSLSAGAGLISYGDELCAIDSGKLYSYSEATSSWVEKGNAVRPSVTRKSVARPDEELTRPQFAAIGNYRIMVYERDTQASPDQAIRYTLWDAETGTTLAYDISITSNGTQPRVLAGASKFYIVYSGSGVREVSLSDPTNPTSATSIVTTGTRASGSSLQYDVALSPDESTLYMVYVDTSDDIRFEAFDTTSSYAAVSGSDTTNANSFAGGEGYVGYSIALVPDFTGADYYFHYAVSENEAGRIVLKGGTFLLSSGTYSSHNSHQQISTISGSGTTYLAGPVGGYLTDDATPNVIWAYAGGVTSSATTSMSTVLVQTSRDFATITSLGSKNGMSVASDPFVVDGVVYVRTYTAQGSGLDLYSIFTINSDGEIVSQASNDVAYPPGQGRAPKVVQSGDVVESPVLIVNRFTVEDSEFVGVTGVESLIQDFSPSTPPSYAVLGKNLFIAQGGLREYDGNVTFQHGFGTAPVIDSVTGTGSGSITFTNSSCCLVHEWQDRNGNVHRSVPSNVIVESEASKSGYGFDGVITTGTDKENVNTYLYRTDDTNPIFYKVGYGDSTTFGVSNADLTANEILYTQGGVLEATPAPACDIVISHQGRLFLAGLEDRNLIRYSNEYEQGVGITFNELLEIRVEEQGGDITALASLDDKLIIFKKRRLYWVSGIGPDKTGQNGIFSQPQVIPTPVGAENQSAVAVTPMGIIFKSEKGFYLLDRGLNVTEIGSEVEEFLDLTITGAEVFGKQDEVRFATSNDKILVYNYGYGRWSWYTGYDVVASVIHDGSYYIQESDGTILKQSATSYLDESAYVSLKVKTGWANFGGPAGIQRLYDTHVIGEYHTPHKLQFKVSYDKDDSTTEDHEVEITSDPYDYDYGIKHNTQKCAFAQYTIQDAAPTSGTGTGQGFSLNGLQLEVGVRGRTKKTPTSRRL